jgi:hypothetical protein
MIVDCDRCAARGHGCTDCVISVLLGPPDHLGTVDHPVDLDDDERRALTLLADAGIVPHLRLNPMPLPLVADTPAPRNRRPRRTA